MINKNEMPQQNEMPPNRKQISDLIETALLLARVFQEQQKQTTSASEKKAKGKKAAEYQKFEGLLSMLDIGLQKKPSPLILKELLKENQDSFLTKAKAETTKEVKNSLFDTADALEKLINFVTSEEAKPSKEWAQKQLEHLTPTINIIPKESAPEPKTEKKEAQQRDSASKQTENIAQERERLLIEKINETGRGTVGTFWPPEYALEKKGGSNHLSNENWPYFDRIRSDLAEKMHDGVFTEYVALYPFTVTYPKKEAGSPAPAKKTSLWQKITGKGSSATQPERRARQADFSEVVPTSINNEPAYTFQYYATDNEWTDQTSKRRGQHFLMNITVPKSLALDLKAKIEQDPTFLRRLLKSRVEFLFHQRRRFEWNEETIADQLEVDFDTAWETGDRKTNNEPLCPPYKKWDTTGNKIHLALPDIE